MGKLTTPFNWSRPAHTHSAMTHPQLQEWLQRLPERNSPLFYIISPGSNGVQTITASEFHIHIQQWAGRLTTVSQLVIPVFGRMTIDMLAAWFGALVAGKKPTFLSYPSHKLSQEAYLEKLANYKSHFHTTYIIGEPEDRNTCSSVITKSELPTPESIQINRTFASEDILFLQCSSGTTGLQKAVGIKVGQLEAQLKSYIKALDIGKYDDCIVSWLPLYHDMGLIACFLLPLLAEIPVVYIDPFEWVANPGSLLQAIEAARGTLCWMPNFAFSLLSKIPNQANLSTVRAFINCSEPVSYSDMTRFTSRHNVKISQIASCYALAENVFAATQTKPGQPPRTLLVQTGALARNRVIPSGNEKTGQLLTSCGKAIGGVEIRIATGKNQQIGEILLRGSSTISAYYGQTSAIKDGWFPTGDLGFIHAEELYICGRNKDLIIHQGKNLYPHDLEAVANSHPDVKQGRTVALGLHDPKTGSEKVLVLVETAKTLQFHGRQSLSKALESKLNLRFGIQSQVAIVPHRWLNKTSSGKMARQSNLRRFNKESKRRISILGDSHVRVFWTDFNTHQSAYKAIKAYWAGVLWADNWQETWPLAQRICAELTANDVLIIQTGEPECRSIFCASHNPIARVQQSISSYRRYFLKLQSSCPGQLVYMSGIPTRVSEIHQPHPEWRCQGTAENRYRWQKVFYSKMQSLCRELNIEFIDACTPLLSSNGMVDPTVFRDGVHLDPKYRPLYLDLFFECFGYFDQSLAPLHQIEKTWDGTYENYLDLARTLVQRITRHPDQVDENHLVTSGTLDSMGLVEFICSIEQFFGFDVQLDQVGRMDFESLDQIWERFHL